MGAALIRSAYSANIKERHDCSTALFDAARRAGHAGRAHPRPPRLDARRGRRRARRGAARRATRWILNDPYRGGTHLPDITLISPVFVRRRADSGSPPAAPTTPTSAARRPGSMPADSTTLDEEGVVIPPTRADDATGCASSPRQMRFPEQRLADLRAQRAANRIGALRLAELAERHGLELLRAGMDEILDYAERRTRAALAELPDGAYAAEDVLEDDAGERPRDVALRVAATIAGERLALDFARHRPPGRGQPQLPALGDQVGRLLRGARADRPRRAALGGRLPPDRGDRPRGLPAQRPRPRPRSSPATSRPRAGSPTW